VRLRLLAGLFAAAVVSAVAADAYAGCRIANETKWSFTVESGNTSNQRVGSHTTTSIAAGKIIGKSDDGKSISGSCKDGDSLVVKEEQGIPVLQHK